MQAYSIYIRMVRNMRRDLQISRFSTSYYDPGIASMGAIWWRTRGTCPPHFFIRGEHNVKCHPTFFSLGFAFGEVSKIKVMYVTFCVKSFSC